MSDRSPPSSPASFHSTYSVLPTTTDTLHEQQTDVKMGSNIVSPSRKSSESSTFASRAPKIAQGKKRLFGAPVLINGVPLAGVLHQEGVPQDFSERPKVYVAKPEDRIVVDENVEAIKPAVDHTALPAVVTSAVTRRATAADAAAADAPAAGAAVALALALAPAPASVNPAALATASTATAAPAAPASAANNPADNQAISLNDLREYKNYDGDFAALTDAEFERELELLKEPAKAYGRVLRKKEREREKETKLAKVRMGREARWESAWEEAVDAGKEDDDVAFKASNNDAHDGKEKKKHDLKKLFSKVGGKIAKVGFKIGKGLMEHAIEGAIEGAGDF
ncbi:hypothetical protein CALCODRAFT_545096 [Calocera cornea HHB12733]|uniref:Uncharacterized protein n=1 Tax=Calocera cornea HHB12733 TaxID=1353952 RepID=A0A165EYL9_9BASI|nr:hypothetical protein CALCODRAFT_545096 [Calocera cornea HHB12733]